LGFRVLPKQIRAGAAGLCRAWRRLRKQQQAYAQGEISLEQLTQSMHSWLAHLEHADSWHLREKLLSRYAFMRK